MLIGVPAQAATADATFRLIRHGSVAVRRAGHPGRS